MYNVYTVTSFSSIYGRIFTTFSIPDCVWTTKKDQTAVNPITGSFRIRKIFQEKQNPLIEAGVQ